MSEPRIHRAKSDLPFHAAVIGFTVLFVALIIGLLAGNASFARFEDFTKAFGDETIMAAIRLSLITCTISALLSLLVAVPVGYVLARYRFPGRAIIDAIIDVPIVLPPLVVGISLLVLFQTGVGRSLDQATQSFFSWIGFPGIRGITYEIPAIVLAQFTVAAAFAIRTMRNTFEQIDDRPELVALTLGARRFRVFQRVALPQAWPGTVAAFTLAWARSLGEFGPILIFAGTARMKTEVLSTTVYLNFQFGNLRGAVVASLILISVAVIVLIATRLLLLGGPSRGRP